MAKKKTVRPLTSHHTEKFLYKFFIDFYNYNYWTYKARILQLIIENNEPFEILFKDEVLSKHPKDNVINSLKFEVYFTLFHSTEALFALIFGLMFNKKNLWFWISEYKFEEINKLINQVSENGIESFAKGREKDLLGYLFFALVPKDHEDNEKIEKSMQFINDYLKRLAKEYSDKGDYNSYKHGLRALNINASVRMQEQDTGKPIFESSTDATVYLGKERVKIDNVEMDKIVLLTKALDYKKAINIIGVNIALIHNIIEARRATLKKKQSTQIKFLLFHDRSVADIFKPTIKGSALVSKFKI